MSAIKYSLLVYWSPQENAFIAEVHDLPGCSAKGSTYQEAVTNAERAIQSRMQSADNVQDQGFSKAQEESSPHHSYITRDSNILSGEPIIRNTRTPVRAIVENWRLGISPEEIPLHLPHLNLAQVFSALSYYLDHQSEINDYIEQNRIPEELLDPLITSS